MTIDRHRESVVFEWDEVSRWKSRRLVLNTASPSVQRSPENEASTLASFRNDELDSGPNWTVSTDAHVCSVVTAADASDDWETQELLVWRLLRRREKSGPGVSVWLEIVRKRFHDFPPMSWEDALKMDGASMPTMLAQVATGERWLLSAEPTPQVVISTDHAYCYLLLRGMFLYCIQLSALEADTHPSDVHLQREGLEAGQLPLGHPIRSHSFTSPQRVSSGTLPDEHPNDSYLSQVGEPHSFPVSAIQVVQMPTEIHLLQRLEDAPTALLAIANDGQLFRVAFMHQSGADMPNLSYTLTALTPRKLAWSLPLAKSMLQSLTTPSRTRACERTPQRKRFNHSDDHRGLSLRRGTRQGASTASSTVIAAASAMQSHLLVLYNDGVFRLWDLQRPRLLAESAPWSFPLAPGTPSFLIPLATSTQTDRHSDTSATFLAVLSVHDPGQALHLQLARITFRIIVDEPSESVQHSLDALLLASADAPAEPLTSCCYLSSQGALCLGWAHGAISLLSLPVQVEASEAPGERFATPWWSAAQPIYTLALEDEARGALHLQHALDQCSKGNIVSRILAPHRFPLDTIQQALQSWLQSEVVTGCQLEVSPIDALDQSLASWCSPAPLHRQRLHDRLQELALREPDLASRVLDRARAFYLERDVAILNVHPWPGASGLNLVIHPWGVALLRPCDEAEKILFAGRDQLDVTDGNEPQAWMLLLSQLVAAEGADPPNGCTLRSDSEHALPTTTEDTRMTLVCKLRDVLSTPCRLLRAEMPAGLIATLAATSLVQVAYARQELSRIGHKCANQGESKSELEKLLRMYAFMVRSGSSPELADQHGHSLAEQLVYSGDWLRLAKMQGEFIDDFRLLDTRERLSAYSWWVVVPTLLRPSPSLVWLLAAYGQLQWAYQLASTFLKDVIPAVCAHLAGLIALQEWTSGRDSDPLRCFVEAWTQLQSRGMAHDQHLLRKLVGNMSTALDYAERMVELLDDHRAHEAAREMARIALSISREELRTPSVSTDFSSPLTVHERTDREIVQTRLAAFLFVRAVERNALPEALSVLVHDLGNASSAQTRDALYLMLQKALELKQVSWLLEQSLPQLCFFRIAEALWRLAVTHDLENGEALYEQACAAYMSRNEWWLAANVAADWAARLGDELEVSAESTTDQLALAGQPLLELERLTRLQEQRQRALQLALFLLHQADDKVIQAAASPSVVDECALRRTWALVRYQLALRRHLTVHERPSEMRFLFETSDGAVRSTAYQLVASPYRFDGESGMMAAFRLVCLWWDTTDPSRGASVAADQNDKRRELARLVRFSVEHWYANHGRKDTPKHDDDDDDDDDDKARNEAELRHALEYAATTAQTGYVFTPALQTWIHCSYPADTKSSWAISATGSDDTNAIGTDPGSVSDRYSGEPGTLTSSTEMSADASWMASSKLLTQRGRTSILASTPQWLIKAALYHESHLSSLLKLLMRKALFTDAARLFLLHAESNIPKVKAAYVPHRLLLQLREALRQLVGCRLPPSRHHAASLTDAESHSASSPC
jgi:hypothetical protein